MRTFVNDIYKDVTYALDEDAYTAAEYHDLVRKRFVKSWENLMEGFKVSFILRKEGCPLTFKNF
jgi:conserved oligomeric Golgi complex subunit 4